MYIRPIARLLHRLFEEVEDFIARSNCGVFESGRRAGEKAPFRLILKPLPMRIDNNLLLGGMDRRRHRHGRNSQGHKKGSGPQHRQPRYSHKTNITEAAWALSRSLDA